ncbi:hypothetical protein VIGAN_08294200 [Vigna angularis var. angularis]|uniref:Uncharacterized protein n=1 Tax=Vigna angularis var. angularis TaxID=157739 RepID=A0A0S3STA0_PHAAN|nr:hypothetical protein VIGAN_08294200 [Vigna angularis var. angularis]
MLVSGLGFHDMIDTVSYTPVSLSTAILFAIASPPSGRCRTRLFTIRSHSVRAPLALCSWSSSRLSSRLLVSPPSSYVSSNTTTSRSGLSKTSQHKIKSQIQYDPLRFQLSAFNQHYKRIQSYAVKADTVPSSESESEASNCNNIVDSVKNFMAVLYQFIYPYALYGHASAAISASLVAVEKLSDISPLFFIGLLQAVLPHSLVLLYVNGVNQLFDFEIDKVEIKRNGGRKWICEEKEDYRDGSNGSRRREGTRENEMLCDVRGMRESELRDEVAFLICERKSQRSGMEELTRAEEGNRER